jgi:hypothetical protein
MLNYGTVDVKTAAGVASTFNLDHVPNPAHVARQLLELAQHKREEELKAADNNP